MSKKYLEWYRAGSHSKYIILIINLKVSYVCDGITIWYILKGRDITKGFLLNNCFLVKS